MVMEKELIMKSEPLWLQLQVRFGSVEDDDGDEDGDDDDDVDVIDDDDDIVQQDAHENMTNTHVKLTLLIFI